MAFEARLREDRPAITSIFGDMELGDIASRDDSPTALEPRDDIMRNTRTCFVFAALFLTCFAANVVAQTTIDFENVTVGAMFENDTAGSTGGPFAIESFNGSPARDVTFTTDSVSGFVDTSSFGLGVNSGGGDPDTESFNIGETWGVSVDVDLLFESIDIGGLQNQETFRIQSDAWINLANINPNPGSSVEFDGSTGTFSLIDDAVPNDTYTLNDLTGGTFLIFEAGVPVVFGDLTSTFGANDDVEIQSLSFFSVPEPNFAMAILFLGMLPGMSRSRRN